ncbi:NAD(P)/FAD-dependent oxidoreductase [Spirochaeta cellobiosiphila]|uniref:NAD(P)/FAD-dependent oxidoreductase n=1 Tax=Spirochaeta cellobiosiphila TaxID=504483 RepID=UPI00042665D7|nr:NAD(P)/FAD-dependent oxidoreductase [Spirochaeta cellobiosiphila]
MLPHIAVIGGGPAGLFTAINVSHKAQVTLYEKKSKLGRKLMITGSGQCNITHDEEPREMLLNYRGNSRFLRNALYHYTSSDLMQFFRSRGVELTITKEGKVFPQSLKAGEILSCLEKECLKSKVQVLNNQKVQGISHIEDKFEVKTNNVTRIYDYVVIATGGMSYPATGSEGDGYGLAKSLGHKIISPKPALVDVHIQDFPLNDCSGLSFRSLRLGHWREGKKVNSYVGDLLITHVGFSGPVILNNSRFMNKHDVLIPDFTGYGDEFVVMIVEALRNHPNKSILNLLKTFDLPQHFVEIVLKLHGINQDLQSANVSKENRKMIINAFLNTKYTIARTGGWKKAMVTAGGVDLKEINPKTMESRISPGLYFAGEVMDIDGDTGGYNLQAAFSSAYTISQAL